MAGKTVTSQVIRLSADHIYNKCEEAEYKYRHHGIFAGFAPFDRPRIAVSAIVEHGCHGSSAAAPIVKNVIQTFMKKYYPDEHKSIINENRKKELLLKNAILGAKLD